MHQTSRLITLGFVCGSLALGCQPATPGADLATSARTSALTGDEPPTQFLSLPIHPRPQADGNGHEDDFNSHGIYRRGGHFIWHAPLINGQPPGQTQDDQSPGTGPAASPANGNGIPTAGGAEIQASGDGAPYHGETTADAAGSLIVGGSNRIYSGGCGANPCGVAAYASSDGGASWVTSSVPMTWNGTTFGITFDPSLDHDTLGNFFYGLGGAPLSSNYPNSIAVARSTDGVNWSTPVAVTFNNNKNFDDKYWLAVDRSAGSFKDRIYIAWDRNQGNNQILQVSYSSDHGAHWTAPAKVNDGTTKFERVIGAYPAVDQSTGTVYLAWQDYAKKKIFVDRSTNGGVTWGTDRLAASTTVGFGSELNCNGGRDQGPAHSLKVGPSGTLHLVYADGPATNFDIRYVRSSNGGVSWSAPVTLNDDASGRHQFHPTLAVAANGSGGDLVRVTFYDRRDDAANCLTHVYATSSVDSGQTWSANTRQTTQPSNFDGNANGPGDYSSSATRTDAGAQWFHSDHRGGGAFQIYSGTTF
jgi:hypothetical protein